MKPLTPADCDLRNFPHMPLDVVRLRDSDLAALESAEAFRAAVLIWCASWHQIPAASLPNDDRVLANLAGFGRVVKEWQKVREGALRGWVLCDDGRLYHPVIAEKANNALDSKYKQEWKTEIARIRKHNQRHPSNQLAEIDFDSWLSHKTLNTCPIGQEAVVLDKSSEKQHPTEQNRTEQITILSNSSENSNVPSVVEVPTSPKVLICKALVQSGVINFNTANPKLDKLVDAGVSVDEIVETAQEIRLKSPDKLKFDYLVSVIIGRRSDAAQLNIAPKVDNSPPWFHTAKGIEAKAVELGLDVQSMTFPYLKIEVFKLAGITDEMVRKANQDYPQNRKSA